MMSKIATLYKKTRLGKIQEWSIWIDNNHESPRVYTEYGLSDGKKQTTYDVIKSGVNIGKANETTAYEQALLTAKRKIEKRKEEGYRNSVSKIQASDTIDFCKPFPKELCFYKPKNSIDKKLIKKLYEAGRSIYTVKRDGMMHIVRKTEKFGVEIYSRRMDLVTNKYPHLVKELDKLDNNTIILGEIISINEDGTDNFNRVSKICRSDPERSIETQQKLGKVIYYAFDLAFLKGRNLLIEENFKYRLDKLKHIVNGMNEYILPVEVLDYEHDEALSLIKKRNLEGLVIWDCESKIKDRDAFTFNGKAYRPNVVWKSKPKYEDDFIVRFDPDESIGEYGKGKNNDKLKSVHIYQIYEGEEIYLGKCGGGLSDEQRKFYTNPSLYPRVWKIEYDSIQEKTGALRYPVFKQDRTIVGDKSLEECIMSEEIQNARKKEEPNGKV